MVQAFSVVLQMSMVGSIAIAAVLAARLLLRRMPRWISYMLWLVVLFRLLCPWSPDGSFSLIPKDLPEIDATTASSVDASPVYVVEAVVNAAAAAAEGQSAEEIMVDVGPGFLPTRLYGKDVLLLAAATLWPVGMAAMLLWNLISLIRLKLSLLATVHSEQNVYEIAGLNTPFVMGLFRPKIYLPAGLTDRERPYILLHEQTHIRRFDHLWKLLAFLALTIHWFNPLIWAAYFCAVKDMETSCDEAVLKQLGTDIRADYSASLLRLTTGRKHLLAFGEGDVKGRIRHILRLKRTTLRLVIPAVLLALLLIFFVAVDPSSDANIFGARYYVNETLYHGHVTTSFTYTPVNAPSFLINETGQLYIRHNGEAWTSQGQLLPTALDIQERNALFPSSNNQVQEIMDDVVTIYKIDDSTQDMHCYLFVYKPRHWNNYHLYMAMGHSEEEMRWLFQLDSPDTVDLEYLDFTIANTWTNAKDAHCFATYEVDGLLLAAWSSGSKTGISRFQIHRSSGRITYDQSGGVADLIDGTVSCLVDAGFIRYGVFATQAPGQDHYDMRVEDKTIPLRTGTVPGLAVEAVPHTVLSYLRNWSARRTAESLVAETTPQIETDDAERDFTSEKADVAFSTPVYDLTANEAVSISTDNLQNYHFYTNSEQITVSGLHIPMDTVIHLHDAATGAPCQEAPLTQGGTITFRNLTASMTYLLVLEHAGNALISISD